MNVETGPQVMQEQCWQVDGPGGHAIALLWPDRAEIHYSAEAPASVVRWVGQWLASAPAGWRITDTEITRDGLVWILTLEPTG